MKEIIRCPFCNHACWRDSLCACIKVNYKKIRLKNAYIKKSKKVNLTKCLAQDCDEFNKRLATQFCSNETREEYKERIEKFRNRNK